MNEDFSKQLSNFVNALIALAPSRNYVVQFLYLTKINGRVDYRILENAYPELMKDEYTRESFAKAFGITFSDKVYLDSRGYGWALVEFVEKVLTLFEDSEFRLRAGVLLKNEYPDGIPNLAEEWVDVRLKGLLSEPEYGKPSIRVLKEVVKVGRANSEYLEKALGISRSALIECLNLLDLYKLIAKEYDGSLRPSDSLRKYVHLLEATQV